MMRQVLTIATFAIVAAYSLTATAEQTSKPAMKMSDQEIISMATSAAPTDIGADATVVDHDDKGQTRELRKGTNNYVCMAHPEVMCIDKNWQEWIDAYVNKRAPKVSGIGIAYMLQGDKMGGSNTDPFATAATPTNQWIVAPAHVMVLTSDTKQLDSLPTDPYSGGPWVMWKGTPYAHIMVPTVPMPKK